MATMTRLLRWAGLLALLTGLTACGILGRGKDDGSRFGRASGKEVACLERAMFFESNRSSRDGLVAVGSVVMNRVASDQYPDTICGVVGQKNQFASGVLSKPMTASGLPEVQEAARAVMRGERHPMIGNAMFFHVASARFGYDNMHYTVTAGGNAFYEKRKGNVTQPVPLPAMEGLTGR
ncbi:cell wall hydrolase [Loktanella sp. DJP18]|uniref:cell wall hydrolase n=1 Tax=Loktanella sp. DJP18 TaxID=3409788 RepID=UPI003BB4D019